MNIKARLSPILATALLAVGTGQAFASSLSEVEPNHPIGQAQMLPGGASNLQVSGTISLSDDPNDVDFYSFHAQAGDVLTVDIDHGFYFGESVDAQVDTHIAIFGPGPTYQLLLYNEDNSTDDGSNYYLDARIDRFEVPMTGTYTVGVTSWPRFFMTGGGTGSMIPTFPVDEGDYELVIDGVSVPDMRRTQMYMEIKPGNNDVAPPINPRSKGKIPVALLGSEIFDVSDVDRDSLTFGATGDEDSLHKCAKRTRDINRDGYQDLLCHFYTAKTGFGPNSQKGHMQGEMVTESTGFEGSAWLKVIPRNRKRVKNGGS